MKFDYFAGAGAGVVAAAGAPADGLLAFLFFFTCFFVVGAVLSVGVAVVCAASDKPAVANVRESPSNTAEIFFIVLSDSFFRRRFIFRLCTY